MGVLLPYRIACPDNGVFDGVAGNADGGVGDAGARRLRSDLRRGRRLVACIFKKGNERAHQLSVDQNKSRQTRAGSLRTSGGEGAVNNDEAVQDDLVGERADRKWVAVPHLRARSSQRNQANGTTQMEPRGGNHAEEPRGRGQAALGAASETTGSPSRVFGAYHNVGIHADLERADLVAQVHGRGGLRGHGCLEKFAERA